MSTIERARFGAGCTVQVGPQDTFRSCDFEEIAIGAFGDFTRPVFVDCWLEGCDIVGEGATLLLFDRCHLVDCKLNGVPLSPLVPFVPSGGVAYSSG